MSESVNTHTMNVLAEHQVEINRLTRENAELREKLDGAEKELDDVAGMVDDILFDPYFNPVDNAGNPIRGKDLYMTDHEIQYDHLPSLRAWFVKRSYKD